LLNLRKFELFKFYSKYENSIKLCEIEIGNKKIVCPQPSIKFSSTSDYFSSGHFYFGNLNESFKKLLHNMDIEKNLEKISFELSTKSKSNYAYIGSLSQMSAKFTFFEPDQQTNIFLNSYSLQKLSKRDNFCNSYNDQLVYSNHEPEHCRFNCLIDNLIKTYECLPYHREVSFFELNDHLKTKNYKFCESYIFVNYSFEMKSSEYCESKCGDECNSISYEISSKSFKSINSTKLNLIPISSHHFRYIETLKMDINGLIYNMGGILSLWFGISPLSFVYLHTLLTRFYRKIEQTLPKYIKYLILISQKLVIKIKSFITICKNLLIICCIKIIESLL